MQWSLFARTSPSKLRIRAVPGEVTLDQFANRVASKLAGVTSPVLVGVHRKGLAILRELTARLPDLGVFPAHASRDSPPALNKAIQNRNVVVIDDSIHRGSKTADFVRRLRQEGGAAEVTCLPVVSSIEGAAAVEFAGAKVDPYLVAPLSEFQELWDKVLVPVVLNLRCGPLSNLMGSEIEFEAGSGSLEDLVVASLDCLARIRGVDHLAETSESSDRTQVFHALIELTEAAVDDQFTKLKADDPGFLNPSEIKFRLFFLGAAPLVFHFVVVVHWHTSTAKATYEEIERRASQRLLDSYLAEFRRTLQSRGILVATQEPPQQGAAIESHAEAFGSSQKGLTGSSG